MADHPAVGSYGETGPGSAGEVRPRHFGMRWIMILAVLALVLVLWILMQR